MAKSFDLIFNRDQVKHIGNQIQDFFSTQCFVPKPNLGQEITIGELILDSVLNQHPKFFLGF